MTNILNSILANQSIKTPAQQSQHAAITYNTDGKIKPLQDKAVLLPSRIFGSPVEYAKDLKKDVVNIGRAFKGQANDHELGRINDVAMKFGSLALATYLFCKTPGKLAKAMEFVGFGTFFGSMALWPKLAIQAPLKARTGVDIHQKYIDSQGRKKMLMQDPQYDLTDLYSQEDLNKIGEKCKVDENLPDRNKFIKQRAKKIAVQGNTLWMLTAGGAPVMSALACNVLEKPLAKAIEIFDLKSTQKAVKKMANPEYTGGFVSSLKQNASARAIEKFLRNNADRVVDERLAEELASLIKTPDASIQTAFKNQLLQLGSDVKVKLDASSVKSALSSMVSTLSDMGLLDASVNIEDLVKANETAIARYASEPQGIAKELAIALDNAGLTGNFDELVEQLSDGLEKAATRKPTLGQVSSKVKNMQSVVMDFVQKKGIIDKFQSVRIGKNADSYIAHQWNNVCDALIDGLGFTTKELQSVSLGKVSTISDKLVDLVKEPDKYDTLLDKLSKMISDYEKTLGAEFVSTVEGQVENLSRTANTQLTTHKLGEIAEHFTTSGKGNILSITKSNVKDRIAGAKSSFYRLLQTLDLFKRAETPEFKESVKKMLSEAGKQADDTAVKKYTELAKKVLFEATNTTYIEKLHTTGFENIVSKMGVDKTEFDIAMKILFNDDAGSTLVDVSDDVLQGFKGYIRDMIGVIKDPNKFYDDVKGFGDALSDKGEAQSKEIGKQLVSYFKDSADKAYNSKQWRKIFGGAMIGLTLVTVIATFFIGKKSKMEKQAEQELKANG